MPAEPVIPPAAERPSDALSSRDRRALAGILLGVSLASLDTAIANTALPAIAADLHAAPAASIWIINAYQLSVVAMLLPAAALGDRLGVQRVYLAGLALFTAASLGCALADSLLSLALARAIQGLGAGALMSVNIALIRLLFPPHRLGRGVGINALVVGIGFALGPTVASGILALAHWPWLFAINVPLGSLALAVAWRSLPKSASHGHAVDPLSSVLTATSFAALIFTLSNATQRNSGAVVGASLAVTLVLGSAMLWRQRGHPAPMVPVDLFRRPMFALLTVTAMASFAAQGLAFVSLPFHFGSSLGIDAVHIGLLMSPWPIVTALCGPVAGRLSDRYPPGLLGGVGLALLSLGLLSLALLGAHPSYAGIVCRMALCGAGFGFFQSPNLRALMTSAPPERSGGASGVIGLARLLGQTTGAALVALCFGWGGAQGPTWALGLGAGSAGLAALASLARLRAR